MTVTVLGETTIDDDRRDALVKPDPQALWLERVRRAKPIGVTRCLFEQSAFARPLRGTR